MPKPLSEQLADLIVSDDRTYAQLAEDSGVDAAVLNRLGNGRSIPRLDTAERVAAALGLRLELVPVRGTRKGAAR